MKKHSQQIMKNYIFVYKQKISDNIVYDISIGRKPKSRDFL